MRDGFFELCSANTKAFLDAAGISTPTPAIYQTLLIKSYKKVVKSGHDVFRTPTVEACSAFLKDFADAALYAGGYYLARSEHSVGSDEELSRDRKSVV